LYIESFNNLPAGVKILIRRAQSLRDFFRKNLNILDLLLS
jgi:hypothetical protein